MAAAILFASDGVSQQQYDPVKSKLGLGTRIGQGRLSGEQDAPRRRRQNVIG